jgi:hypothetical protein
MAVAPLYLLRARLAELANQTAKDLEEVKDAEAQQELEIARDLFQGMIANLDKNINRPKEQ